MKDEAPTILPAIGFVVTAILAARIIVLYNLRLSRTVKRLKQAYAADGRAWDYRPDLSFRLRLLRQPNSIREAGDSLDIRKAKEEMSLQGRYASIDLEGD